MKIILLYSVTYRESALWDEVVHRLADVGRVNEIVVRIGVLAVTALQSHQEILDSRIIYLQRPDKTQRWRS